MRSGKAAWLALLGLLVASCGGSTTESLPPLGQVLLFVNTDAPLPPPPGQQLAPEDPAPLFDRLRIELFAPGQTEPCPGCSREFEIDRDKVARGQISVGVAPKPGERGYVARLRLFRGLTVRDGEPPVLSTIEAFAALPVVAKEGIVKATVVLPVDDVGVPRGSLEAPVEPDPGTPDSALVGSWAPATRVPCSESPREGEACVPGGAFWMGNPILELGDEGANNGQTRLVVLDPYFIDLHEVTVAEFRASGLLGSADEGNTDPLEGAFVNSVRIENGLPPFSIFDLQYFCDFSLEPSVPPASNEALALNCVSWNMAHAYCGMQGRELPTEAQYEYVAGALASRVYAWGEDRAGLTCEDAAFDRSGVGVFIDGKHGTCRPTDSAGGPSPPGSGRLDRVSLAGGEVVDLAANVSEWAVDDWNRLSEACWVSQPLLKNPRCDQLGQDGDERTGKGGSWGDVPKPAANRYGASANTMSVGIGFRCVRPNP